jgi:3-dehydroquinate synthase
VLKLEVGLGDRSYPIHIGTGIIGDAALYAAFLRNRQVLVVSNPTVASHWLAPLLPALAGASPETLLIADGEAHKSLATLEAILSRLLELRFDRTCTLVALGGGVVGDITGFAAAIYQRGVQYIQVPTTLLAQVDSSVGGKTAVNHPLGKNMIGAFHQPRAVIADLATLATLPDREYVAGLAEVIKYGLIRDALFFEWLESNMARLRARETEALTHAVARSCRIKAEVVARDECESGLREILNLGHTFGHAIETGTGHGTWLHGEAVAVGLSLAADLSVRLGRIDADLQHRIDRLIEAAGLPVDIPAGLDPARMQDLMRIDKKARNGRIRLVLLEGLGEAMVTADYPGAALDATLARAPVQSA